MVVTQFGSTIHIDEENLWGENCTELRVQFTCIDPKRIPFSSLLPFSNSWEECYIEIVGWEYLDNPPPEARYEPDEDEDARTSLVGAHEKLLLYMAQRSPPPSSSSSASSVTPEQVHDEPGTDEISTHAVHTPSPGGYMKPTNTINENPNEQYL